jgi:hypothetical protein
MADELTPLEAMTKRAIDDHDARQQSRRASEVIASDESLQTFSARLHARDLVRLRSMARSEGISASDLLRTLLQQGLDRLETRQQKQVDPNKAVRVLAEIVKLVEAFDDVAPAITARPSPRTRQRPAKP